MENFNATMKLVFIFSLVGVFNFQLFVCADCTSNSTVMTCYNVTELPYPPSEITDLVITNSSDLKNISYVSENLLSLSFHNTGLQQILNNSIGSSNLKVLVMERCDDLIILNLGGLKEKSHPLEELQIFLSRQLHEVFGIENYASLQNIRLSRTKIKKIDGTLFSGLDQLTSLDLSHNKELSNIDEYAFQDLEALQEFNISDCNLPTLYPAYFEAAQRLQSVWTIRNPFECLQMCEFSQWARANPSFTDIAHTGFCFIETTDSKTYYDVNELDDIQAGCPYTPTGLIIGLVFASIFFVLILGYIIVVAFEIDYKRWFCCCLVSGANHSSAEDDFWRERTPDDFNDITAIDGPQRQEKEFGFEDLHDSFSNAPPNNVGRSFPQSYPSDTPSTSQLATIS